ncbi:MAG TPA: hypothetical protein VN663_14210 [Ramlibacter sp.]|jgi:hypothetical protein|nr:hypothetical protein [Ramlibacter sp.]
MLEYIKRHWAAIQRMRRERVEAERKEEEHMNEWRHDETWSEFVNRMGKDDHAVLDVCMFLLGAVFVLVLAVEAWDKAIASGLS